MSRAVNRETIKSAARAFAVLEFFNRERRPATVSALSAALEMPQSSTSMLIKCLVELGFVQQLEGTRYYIPGSRSAFLSDWALECLGQTNPLAKLADDLAQELGETVVIGSQNGPYVQCIHVASHRGPTEVMSRVGMKFPMACTASGRSILSRLQEDNVRMIIRRNNAEFPAHAHLPERRIVEKIRQEKSQGYFESRGDFVSGIDNIAVPFWSKTSGTPMMIGVGGPSERIAPIRPKVVDCLTTLERDFVGGNALYPDPDAPSISPLPQ
jgi:DNA-binding IclR family transcriptional regulator